MTLVVRPIELTDHEALIALYRTAFGEHGSTWNALQAHHIAVATLDGVFAGFGFADRVRTDGLGGVFRARASIPHLWHQPQPPAARARPGDAVFTAMAVVPELRRRGVGRALAEARIDHARRTGSERVFVHCLHGSGSDRLYASLGFDRIVTVERYYRTGASMTLMVAQIGE